MTSDIAPFRQGQTYPPCHWNFLDTLGNTLPMPTGTVFTQYIFNPNTGQTKQGAGTFTVINLSLGQVDYDWGTADSSTPGNYEVYAGFLMPNGQQGFTLPIPWPVIPIQIQQ